MSKPKLKTAAPLAVDPVALARRKTASRLRRARLGLEALEFQLQALHADVTGSARLYYGSTVPILEYETQGKWQGIRRTQREAAEGCELCARWLEETSDLRERIGVLRNTPLPMKDPSYTGWPLTMRAVAQIGKVRAKGYHYLQDRPRPNVASLLAEQEAKRAERKARGAALLQGFAQELEEAAQAKAAAGVPH
jgi:hypothetical protein